MPEASRRKAKARMLNPGKIAAIARAADVRRQERIAFFTRATRRAKAIQLTGSRSHGQSIVHVGDLVRPSFIFEHNGRRTFEPWPKGETQVSKTTAEEVENAWAITIAHTADSIEQRATRLAKRLGCKPELMMDALTLELTGRFIGRERERRRLENGILAKQRTQ